MAAINVGPGYGGRTGNAAWANQTLIALGNPADGTGSLDKLGTHFDGIHADALNVKIGTFSGAGTDYTSRDFETVGTVTAGSPQLFSGLDCDVVTGDYLGILWTNVTAYIEIDWAGQAGFYKKNGDFFGGGEETYTLQADSAQSVYGTGETPPEEEEAKPHPFYCDTRPRNRMRFHPDLKLG